MFEIILIYFRKVKTKTQALEPVSIVTKKTSIANVLFSTENV